MAIPAQSLSGTEVLRRGFIGAQSNTFTSFKFDGTSPAAAGSGPQAYTVPTNHIITMLSIIVCEQGGVAELFSLWINSSPVISILADQAIGNNETFVWNERFSLIGGDSLRIACSNAANLDIVYSYIDQSWV